MRLGVAPLYPSKGPWLEGFPEALGDWAVGVPFLTLFTFFLPSTPHHVHNQASKTWSSLDQKFSECQNDPGCCVLLEVP